MLKTASLVFLLTISSVALARDSAPESGDLVRITVYGMPDLTTVTRVESDGHILFPFVGRVRVGDGLSMEEAAANIARGLEQQGIVRNPQVSLLISQERDREETLVTILGEVAQPGRYPLPEDSATSLSPHLIDLIAMAGGTTPNAGFDVTIFRRSDGAPQRIEVGISAVMDGVSLANGNESLQEGDVVIVPKADVFYIYGQVKRPGRYLLTSDLMTMQAISLSGGVTERGSERDITVTRESSDNHRTTNIKLDEVLEPNDVLFVKEKFF